MYMGVCVSVCMIKVKAIDKIIYSNNNIIQFRG